MSRRQTPPPDLSVVIPVLNEAGTLPRLLPQLRAQRGLRLEVIVVDGGSRDETPGIARRHRARLLRSRAGRGRQMNAGAGVARADWLLFLHADASLPDPELLAGALAALAPEAPQVAGHFGLRFEQATPGPAAFYRWLEAKSRLSRPGTIHGDQGMLLRRRFFETLGGFDERLPIMEDEDLAARVFAHGGWRLLPGTLHTSARRFETEGVLGRYLLMGLMLLMWEAGQQDFFRQARGLYPPPGEGRAMPLLPFLRLARRQLRRLPPQARHIACRRAARLLLGNSWQLSYVLSGMHPTALALHDRWLQPLADAPLIEALAGRLLATAVGGRGRRS